MAVSFSIKKDTEKIAAGTHFFCKGHLAARPITEQSPNKDYCTRCYNRIKNLETANTRLSTEEAK